MCLCLFPGLLHARKIHCHARYALESFYNCKHKRSLCSINQVCSIRIVRIPHTQLPSSNVMRFDCRPFRCLYSTYYTHVYCEHVPIRTYNYAPVCVSVLPGPNDQTVEDFWRMVWQLRPPTVVMITNVMEGSKFKCEQYWPEYGSMVCGSFKVVLADQQVFANFTVRTLLLSVSAPTRDTAFRLNPSLSPPH